MKNIKKIGWVGLGVMGGPMAGHLNRAGYDVTAYNRTESKAALWANGDETRHVAATPALAARGADMVCLCVGNDDDIRAVITGTDGVLSALAPGAIIVDHTTASADIAREMAALCAKSGIHFLDAPVSGGQAGAEKGALSVMAGGDEAAFACVEPVLRAAYAKEMRRMGDSGAGQLAKMVNQICIAGTLQGLSEALSFGDKAGLDMGQVLAAIGQGAAQSWQMDNRAHTMLLGEFDFGFAVDWMVKDLEITMGEAGRLHADLSVTRQILSYYKELQKLGFGREDASALIRRLR